MVTVNGCVTKVTRRQRRRAEARIGPGILSRPQEIEAPGVQCARTIAPKIPISRSEALRAKDFRIRRTVVTIPGDIVFANNTKPPDGEAMPPPRPGFVPNALLFVMVAFNRNTSPLNRHLGLAAVCCLFPEIVLFSISKRPLG
jgi:hypothetical protein